MPVEPVINITYRKPTTSELSREPGATGLLLSEQDVHLLRQLQGLPVLVQLHCPGAPTFHVRVPDLLPCLQVLAEAREWLMPAASVGALAGAAQTLAG